MKTAKPPLLLWLLLLLVVAALVAGLIGESRHKLRSEAESLDSALMRVSSGVGDRPVVLIIGTSLTQSGLDSSSHISRCVKERTGKEIVLLKCWVSGGDLERISNRHETLFHRLHPAVVFVEDNLLFYRPLKTPPLSVFAQTFRDMIGGRIRRPYDPDERAEVLPADRLAIEAARSGMVDSTDLARFRDICAFWHKAGTRIALAHLPLELKMEEKKWNSGDTSTFLKNLAYLQEATPLSRYDARLKLDSSFFFDFGHLNDKGSSLFAPFFCGFVATELAQTAANDKMPGK